MPRPATAAKLSGLCQNCAKAFKPFPFLVAGKVVWLQNCNFLGGKRAASAAAVTENLAQLAKELTAFTWENVRLLISAGKVDRRKVFYKTLEKVGAVELFAGWSPRIAIGPARPRIARSRVQGRQKGNLRRGFGRW